MYCLCFRGHGHTLVYPTVWRVQVLQESQNQLVSKDQVYVLCLKVQCVTKSQKCCLKEQY